MEKWSITDQMVTLTKDDVMKSFIPVLLMLFAFCANLAAVDLIDPPRSGMQYETLRFRFVENLPFENPFDLETNQVELHIQLPDFTKRTISFFYDGVNAAGVQQWEARFAPKQIGLHRMRVVINGKAQEQFEVSVKANQSNKRGGLKIADRFGVFEYENGEAFRGIGMNICWTDDYEYYFKKMQAAGMNVTRIWMCPWNLPFEWKETGLGRYNLESARRFDTILELADKYGVHIILCMDFHGIAPKGLGFFREDRWPDNPYNKINGGPCADRAELFSNAQAVEFSKRRYKYIVSRFGHSSQIACWEFFNEADLMAGRANPMNRWHIDMGHYFKSIDVHERMVSTSGTRGLPEKVVEAFKSPAMDFVMYHQYNMMNVAGDLTNLHEVMVDYYQKPFVLGEFGVEFRGGDLTYKADPQGVGLHNGIWSGWFSETPVIPLSWWWDNYIDPHNFWGEFANLSRFAERMNFNTNHLVFKSLIPGRLEAKPEEQAACMVRIISSGGHCALWMKNDGYVWSLVAPDKVPLETGAFTQPVPDLVPGRYSIAWFDPQTGKFNDKTVEVEVKADGVLSLAVPSFAKDLACLISRL